MDSGAHFYKCDFQVHTPRDINWQGAGAVTEEERRQYAQDFVVACRARGLEGVAITDHHDLAFFKYIREAALGETDDAGKPLPPGARLVVFPGMELTLGIPCQALLLFDAEIPVEFLPLALPALGITPSAPEAATHAPVSKLDIMSFDDLYEALNKLEPLRNRFIVFPHIGDSGYKTILRKDFEKHYISMPCVGGYVDGPLPVEPKAAGMRTITSGQDKNWGNKPLGLLQTSDSRSRDFADLGKHATWVKWARPTAEALRQACLGRHSRISHAEPRLPSIEITRIEVSNSKFLGPIGLDFNPQYNAVIGGRGTGKSTILEYMRWALCDQPPSGPDAAPDERADFQRRRQALIEGTLLPLGSVVDVSFLLNGVPHIVRRKAVGDLTLKIGDTPFQVCTEQNVRELLPVRAYSQKQLSAVGARLDELRRFVHAPIQAELDAFEERLGSLAADLRIAFDRVIRFRTLQTEIAAHEIERRSLTEQIEKLRASLKGLSDADRATIGRQGAYEAEQRVVQALQRDANAAEAALATAATECSRLPAPIDTRNTQENGELLKHTHATLADWISHARDMIAGLQGVFADPVAEKALGQYFAGVADWSERRDVHRREYEQAKARAAVHEQTLSQIQMLETRLAEINEAADAKEQQLDRLGDPAANFSALRAEWKATHRKRADSLEEQCGKLTAVSKSRLRATLRRATDIIPLAETLKQLMKGTKTRGDRVDNLLEQVRTSGDPLETWHRVLDELLELAWQCIEDEAVATLPPVPRLDSAGFTQKEKIALARQLKPPAWLDLLLFDLRDLPVFEYQVRPDDFLPFENASPGQQATALLSILLLQDGPPLLIDQPEDDLNMKIINDIVATLWQAKTHRQVLFTSHNANLVVNGDAELVICCDYRASATESGGQIKLTGAIDLPKINSEIAEVMEGGIEAFKLRQKKYGF
jgi:chromosome segregation protein